MLTLIGGGARSGKSAESISRARKHISSNGRVLFIATAEPVDDEMQLRIDNHRKERSSDYDLVEEPTDLVSALKKYPENGLVIVDCLTIWLSNLMMADIDAPIEDVITTAKSRNGSTIFVTNETGEGIVPMHPVSRKFRDLSGSMNQSFARYCDEVIFMRFGIAVKLK
jgi:adenosyl cobinamide kinase/adenosyl cobinamide phosphate guanylyltransferase